MKDLTHNERLMLGIAPCYEGDSRLETLQLRARDDERTAMLETAPPIPPKLQFQTTEEFNAWLWKLRGEMRERAKKP